MNDITSVILFNGVQAPDWILPSFLRKVKLAVRERQQYLTEAAKQEPKAGITKRTGASLVSALIQANEGAKDETRSVGGLLMHLSDQGALREYVYFNPAGYETTSNPHNKSLNPPPHSNETAFRCAIVYPVDKWTENLSG